MRSRLLLSVAHLPTIREISEEMLPGGPGQESPASPSLDDYVKSICQLSQPTSVPDKVTARSGPGGPHGPARGSKKSPAGSPQDSTSCFPGQQPTLPSAGAADPLNRLFGESQGKEPDRKDLPGKTGLSAGHSGAHRQTDSGKAKGRLCEARAPGLSLIRPSQDGHQSANLKHRTCSPAKASPCSPRPSSILRSLYLHLPVIHEL